MAVGLREALLAVALPCAALLAAGCGGDGPDRSAPVAGDTLTVYASLPTRGPAAGAGRAAELGMRRALADAGGRAAGRRVRLVALSSTPAGDGEPVAWDPGAVEANAERAVEDPTAIAYIGELERGGSAVSLPVTNREGLLQVAPADGLTSLTRRPPGRPRAGPERYYPDDLRTFVRLVPPDVEAARAIVAELASLGAARALVLYGDGIAERELEGMVAALATEELPSLELDSRPLRELDPERAVDLLSEIVELDPQAVVLAGGAGSESELILAALGARLPDVPVLGGPALEAVVAGAGAEAPPTTCAMGGLSGALDELPPRGRRLLGTLRRAGGAVGTEALLGYEAMTLTLDAIDTGGPDRLGVVRAAHDPRERHGVLGAYAVDRRGDVAARTPVGCEPRAGA